MFRYDSNGLGESFPLTRLNTTQVYPEKLAKSRFWEKVYLVWVCETKTGVVRALVIFQDRPMFSHTILKASARAFN